MKKFLLPLLSIVSISVAICSYLILYKLGYALSIEDGRAHLDVARRVFDSLTPGFAQLGGIWLPLPHILMFPLIWNDTLWHTGLAGAIPSMIAFVLSSLIIYKFTKSYYSSVSAGLIAFAIFISNPNLLFVQAQPMTESFSMLFFISTVYLFWLWTQKKNMLYLFGTGLAAFLATLTRYEGWILPISIVLGIIVIGIRRKWRRDRIEGSVIIASTVAFFGIFLWIFFNFVIFGKPFNFLSGEGSATWFAQFEAKSAQLPAKGNLILSFGTYFLNMADVLGVIICFMALVGLGYFLLKVKKMSIEKVVIFFILLAPILFNIYSLFSGSSVMWNRWIFPHKIYNVRYVLLAFPLVIYLISGISRIKMAIPFIVVGLIAQILLFSLSGPIVIFKDITQTSHSARESVASWVKNHPTNGYTLISAGANEVIIFESGQPINKFIYEGNNKIWDKALKSPYPAVSRIIMGSVIGPQTDKVYVALNKNKALKDHYVLSYSRDNYYVYDKKDYLTNIPTEWSIKSLDTMKTSRDRASQGISKVDYKTELQKIKLLNANYVAIDTPYDEEFYPILKAWADEAHRIGLGVWFRGNWSGWEGWNGYDKSLTRTEHLGKTRDFIIGHSDLFRDGDIFTPCPECEYGSAGSPLNNKDYGGFTNFMIAEYEMMQDSFSKISKNVNYSLFSMNPDVARAIYTKDLLDKTGNTITLDYFVNSPEELSNGLEYFHNKFPNSKIIIGEFGAPIPEINGQMTSSEQSVFLEQIIQSLSEKSYVTGFNYWTSTNGSTAIINQDFSLRPAAKILQSKYKKSSSD